MKKILTTFVICLATISTFAQTEEQFEEIKKQLSDSQLETLTTAQENLASGQTAYETANQKLTQIEEKRQKAKSASKKDAKKLNKEADAAEPAAITQTINALNKVNKAQKTIYETYAENLLELKESADAKKRANAAEILTDAGDAFDNANKTLKKVPTGKKVDQKQVLTYKTEANSLYKAAIAKNIEAYAELLGWNEPKEEPKQTNTENVNTAPVQEVKKDKVIFKVQIAADTKPLTLAELREIYPSHEIINNELYIEKGYYRYSVGYYNTYKEAEAAKNRMGVQGAWIVKFVNSKRVELTEEDKIQ